MPTFAIQIASGLINRMLPAGLGGLGINALYLKKQQLSLAVASAVVATNNLLGFIGNVILIALVLVFTPRTLPKTYHLGIHLVAAWIGIGAVLFFVTLSAVIYLRHPGPRGRIARLARETARYFVLLARRSDRSITALLSSCALTSLQTTALCFVMMAVGLPADWTVALMAISAGAVLTSLVPTPGGLGGAEAGISTALFAFGVSSELAIAAALIYRGITYWLPLLPGYLAFRFAEKRFL